MNSFTAFLTIMPVYNPRTRIYQKTSEWLKLINSSIFSECNIQPVVADRNQYTSFYKYIYVVKYWLKFNEVRGSPYQGLQTPVYPSYLSLLRYTTGNPHPK